jgi:ribonuclease HI
LNPEIFDLLGALIGILDAHPHIVIHIEWVPGHTKVHGNEIADRLTKRGS